MLKKLLLVVAALIAVLLILIWSQPDDFRLERSVTIAAPASVVFPYVNDFRRFNAWNPFLKGEANFEETYAGPASGEGASYSWKGEETGAGRMTILASQADASVRMRLEFLAPMEATDLTDFTLSSSGSDVTLSWALSGPNLFLGKALNLVGGMEAMVGPEFDRGLAKLKSLAEAEAARLRAETDEAARGGDGETGNVAAPAIPNAPATSSQEP